MDVVELSSPEARNSKRKVALPGAKQSEKFQKMMRAKNNDKQKAYRKKKAMANRALVGTPLAT